MIMREIVIAVGMIFFVLTAAGCAITSGPETASAIIFDDKAITSEIKARHAERALTGISVETLYGVVLLSGVAKSPQDKLAAQNLAGEVDGVRAVHNEVLVSP